MRVLQGGWAASPSRAFFQPARSTARCTEPPWSPIRVTAIGRGEGEKSGEAGRPHAQQPLLTPARIAALAPPSRSRQHRRHLQFPGDAPAPANAGNRSQGRLCRLARPPAPLPSQGAAALADSAAASLQERPAPVRAPPPPPRQLPTAADSRGSPPPCRPARRTSRCRWGTGCMLERRKYCLCLTADAAN